MIPQPLKISKESTDKISYKVDQIKMLSGSPDQAVWDCYNDPTEQFSSGIWEGAVAKWNVRYTEQEFCYLIKGLVVLCDTDGNSHAFKEGEGFVVPAGFEGTWENLEPAAKFYAIMELKE